MTHVGSAWKAAGRRGPRPLLRRWADVVRAPSRGGGPGRGSAVPVCAGVRARPLGFSRAMPRGVGRDQGSSARLKHSTPRIVSGDTGWSSRAWRTTVICPCTPVTIASRRRPATRRPLRVALTLPATFLVLITKTPEGETAMWSMLVRRPGTRRSCNARNRAT